MQRAHHRNFFERAELGCMTTDKDWLVSKARAIYSSLSEVKYLPHNVAIFKSLSEEDMLKVHKQSIVTISVLEESRSKIDDFLSTFVTVLGVRGSGKSNTAARLCEQFIKKQVGMSIFDIKGEYYTLQVMNPDKTIIVGGEHATREMTDAAEIASDVVKNSMVAIIDFSGVFYGEQVAFMIDYLQALWEAELKLRIPHFIVLEEAHQFIPQNIGRISDERVRIVKELIQRIALQGRSYGLGAIIITQRPAKIDKDVISQAERMFLHKVVYPNDIGVYCELIPEDKASIRAAVPKLQTGDVIYVYGNDYTKTRVLLRETEHPSFTPKYEHLLDIQGRELPEAKSEGDD